MDGPVVEIVVEIIPELLRPFVWVAGLAFWIAMLGAGAWFVFSGPIYMAKTAIQSRRTVRLLFSDGPDAIPRTPFGYRSVLDSNGSAELPIYDGDAESAW